VTLADSSPIETAVATVHSLAGKAYLPRLTVGGYLNLVEERFPELAPLLDFERPGTARALDELCGFVNEFETDDDGRGGSYRRAQRNQMVRARGIRALFALAADVGEVTEIPAQWRLLDLLGGDGLLAQVCRTIAPQAHDAVITSDMAGHMVSEALRNGLPALRQQAQYLFLRDETVDAVLVGYGSHHIPRRDRPQVAREAARVLLPGGRFVLHDFEEGSPVSLWFSEVVDNYSPTGHQYDHFTVPEMRSLLEGGGLRGISVRRMYDPLVTTGETAAEARGRMADYLMDMYGLTGLADPLLSPTDVQDLVWKLAANYMVYTEQDGPEDAGDGWMREPTVYRDGSVWTAEVPRVALVAVGRK